MATMSPCPCGCLRSEPHPAHPGVTENQHGRVVHRGTKGSNPLSSSPLRTRLPLPDALAALHQEAGLAAPFPSRPAARRSSQVPGPAGEPMESSNAAV